MGRSVYEITGNFNDDYYRPQTKEHLDIFNFGSERYTTGPRCVSEGTTELSMFSEVLDGFGQTFDSTREEKDKYTSASFNSGFRAPPQTDPCWTDDWDLGEELMNDPLQPSQLPDLEPLSTIMRSSPEFDIVQFVNGDPVVPFSNIPNKTLQEVKQPVPQNKKYSPFSEHAESLKTWRGKPSPRDTESQNQLYSSKVESSATLMSLAAINTSSTVASSQIKEATSGTIYPLTTIQRSSTVVPAATLDYSPTMSYSVIMKPLSTMVSVAPINSVDTMVSSAKLVTDSSANAVSLPRVEYFGRPNRRGVKKYTYLSEDSLTDSSPQGNEGSHPYQKRDRKSLTYREQRYINNMASKRSREKRRSLEKQMKLDLLELEKNKLILEKRAEILAVSLTRVNKALIKLVKKN